MMNDPSLAHALHRAERALERIERAREGGAARSQMLREKVRGVVAELDDMIRAGGER